MTNPPNTEDQTKEEWKTIPDFEDYEISTLGRIKRRVNGKNGPPAGYLMKQFLDRGYYSVRLSNKGKCYTRWLHRLVLLAFRGPCPSGHEGSHLNGVSGDCRLTNLRWETPAQNNQRRLEHGTSTGENNPAAKLKEWQVKEIRKLYKFYRVTQNKLAKQFGIAANTVSQIVTNKKWKHI